MISRKHAPWCETERSLRRSRIRTHLLLILARVREAYPAQLAALAGTDERRVRWAMHGHLPQYQDALGLVPLGLVQEHAHHGRVLYRIMPAGRRKALEWTRPERDGGMRLPQVRWQVRAATPAEKAGPLREAELTLAD